MERFQLQPERDGEVGPVYDAREVAEVLIGRDESKLRGHAGDKTELLVVDARHESVSGYHARVYVDAKGAFWLQNKGQNGTFLNGKRLPSESPERLRGGDRIQLSNQGPAYRFNERVEVPEPVRALSVAEPVTEPSEIIVPGVAESPTVELARALAGRDVGTRTVELFRAALGGAIERRVERRFKAAFIGLGVAVVSGGVWAAFQHKTFSGRFAAYEKSIALMADQEAGRAREAARGFKGLERKVEGIVASGLPFELTPEVERSVFAVGVIIAPRSGGSERLAMAGTGFAVRRDAIATNAHVALALRQLADAVDLRSGGGDVVVGGFARRSGTHETCQFRLSDMRIPGSYTTRRWAQEACHNNHPGWRDEVARCQDESCLRAYADCLPRIDHFYDDIAAVKTSCTDLEPFSFVPSSEFKGLSNGGRVAVAGFPGLVASATGGLRAAMMNGALVDRSDQVVVFDATTGKGSSGAPILDTRRRIVGVNAGSWGRSDETTSYSIGVSGPVLDGFLRSHGF
ncbi:MAG: FHA domain-containing protein [Elusimicrobia bacterium]|nr:FHA domain-containing protein [Elusimicrobiota bacterium]